MLAARDLSMNRHFNCRTKGSYVLFTSLRRKRARESQLGRGKACRSRERPAGGGALYLDPDLSQGAVLFVKVQRRAVSLSRMGDMIEPD